MVNPTIDHRQAARLWMLSPSCLIDKILDRLENLCGFVGPAKVGDPLHVETAARLEQFGA
jgi:hypothetical protein